ncbi:hypothetical protein [Nostoc sp. WHI]|uniref:hypothetical protein n=1 Tax=Nostoc sp. WHI TaxID=2650611 RepID=UPI0018C801EB|nr:hypothetical protein [Nostoc sp. WHI]MBG1265339.1 hypothetical protein [Nostoc sp. WHI]
MIVTGFSAVLLYFLLYETLVCDTLRERDLPPVSCPLPFLIKCKTGVKAEVPTEKTEFAKNYAIHGKVLPETLTEKVEAATGCAIHGNVKAEAATGCAIHGNFKAEATIGEAGTATGKAEAATGEAGTATGEAGTATGEAGTATGKAEAATGKAEAATRKAEAATDCTKSKNVLAQVAENFKETIEIFFDDFLLQWNYVSKPQQSSKLQVI